MFDCSHGFNTTPASQYRWYQVSDIFKKIWKTPEICASGCMLVILFRSFTTSESLFLAHPLTSLSWISSALHSRHSSRYFVTGAFLSWFCFAKWPTSLPDAVVSPFLGYRATKWSLFHGMPSGNCDIADGVDHIGLFHRHICLYSTLCHRLRSHFLHRSSGRSKLHKHLLPYTPKCEFSIPCFSFHEEVELWGTKVLIL